MLDQPDANIDEVEPEPEHVFRSNVPILTAVQLSASRLHWVGEEEVSDKAAYSTVCDEKFEAELQNLTQLSLPELHDLRRKIALHSHPDLKFKAGVSSNFDLMSQANSLIDDEIKRRLTDDAGS